MANTFLEYINVPFTAHERSRDIDRASLGLEPIDERHLPSKSERLLSYLDGRRCLSALVFRISNSGEGIIDNLLREALLDQLLSRQAILNYVINERRDDGVVKWVVLIRTQLC